jgi:hypothetical protein
MKADLVKYRVGLRCFLAASGDRGSAGPISGCLTTCIPPFGQDELCCVVEDVCFGRVDGCYSSSGGSNSSSSVEVSKMLFLAVGWAYPDLLFFEVTTALDGMYTVDIKPKITA